MHILMIAPEPFFEPRGTPFSEFHRIRALTSLGHTVDLVTYPFGRDVDVAGACASIDALRPPFVGRIGIGPSWAKVPLDAALAVTALRLALTRRYDAVHSHEEGRRHRRAARELAAGAAPLRHAFEPAAADHQLRLRATPAGSSRCSDGSSAS